MWLLIAAYAFALGWNVHEVTTPREPITATALVQDGETDVRFTITFPLKEAK
jgi:hypothetical protein